ncbi:aspartate--tRNA(Asn) ligase [Agathobaculum sp.]|uniref:aspartate--tRNA(Asn) ligase n=1 Tax=Agathobaculum sp. TaxID=2048138 RepID=UPI002A80ABE0|nr:aspartate--tRNA(Asn) ligase [Agathobaculum sp.]MDY3619427.1 aspartate--tRNA(Asn) ligase [Agathobaculum sp.]
MEFINDPKQYTDTVELVKNSVGQEVTFRGTVHRVRDMSDFAFLIVRTERGLVQCTFQGDTLGDIQRADVKDAMVVEVTGKVHEEPRAEHGVEVVLSRISILARPYDQLPVPLGKKYMGLSLDVDLPLRPVTLRHPIKQAVFRVQGAIADGFAEYMLSQGFTHIHTPKIVSAGAEGGANIFKLDYFGQQAYLAQSPQFYKQYTAGVFGRVFEIGNVYRAERHNTSRHLNEYIGLDFEMAYIDSMYDVMQMETGMLKYVLNYVKEHCPEELALLKADIPEIKEIPSIRFHEAKEIMESKFGHKSKNRYDLNPDEEVMLCDWAKQEHGSEFVFVTHFPSSKRPFYAMDDPDDKKLALSFDLLFRGLEITTGGQRIHDYQEQIDKLAERNMNAELFESFTMLHKYGMPPHGGLGIGLERLTMQLLKLANVRDASMFPRDMNRLEP